MKYIKYILFALIIYFPVFWNLDYMPVRLWDESRLAINAFEMYKNGNYLVTYFDGLPDMWNTKPPLMIWLQVLMFKTFGVSVFSMRIPSALAAMFTALALMVFSIKYLKSFWFGFIAVLVLVSIDGYVNFHSIRTGDYDSLLTLFTTLGGLLFYLYIETKNSKYLLFFFLALSLSVLTKGIAGLLFIPGIIIYSLWKKQVFNILSNKYFYIGVILFVIPIAAYYILRESYNNGYLEAVFSNEIWGRYFKKENFNDDILYYLKIFTRVQLVPWYIFIPISIAIGFLSKNRKIKNLTVYLIILIFSFLVVISYSKTKTSWYDVPLFPFISLLISIFLYEVFLRIREKKWIDYNLINQIVPFLFLISVAAIPYMKIIKKNATPQDYIYEKRAYELGAFLRDATKGINNLEGYITVYSGYRPQIDFYHKILNIQGVNISFKNWDNLRMNDKVLVIQDQDKEKIEKKYDYKILLKKNELTIYEIN